MRHAIETVVEADEPGAGEIGSRRSIIIERITPELDGGRYPVKRVVGDQLLVTADIFADGHDLLDAAIVLRADDEATWRRAPLRPIDNDRWSGHV
ncbi:MAG: DUF3416 domain-containing protein, partial [Chloroflexota bacterium]|nr:DUF3416 domain-containing protein [Chloroflexota bacterium]